jgi:hypothetical protein
MEMKFAIEALLVLAGFAAGVIFSGVVRAFADKQILAMNRRALELEEAVKAEAGMIRARVVELEQKVKSRF